MTLRTYFTIALTKENERQHDCLAMNLESGLHRSAERSERTFMNVGIDCDDDPQRPGNDKQDSYDEFEHHWEEDCGDDNYEYDQGSFRQWAC